MADNKKTGQMVWGTLLVLAGLGVFYRIPQVMPRIQTIDSFSSEYYFIQVCFYLMGAMLVVGGAKKIYKNYHQMKNDPPDSPPDGP
jgi:hypothetical protein